MEPPHLKFLREFFPNQNTYFANSGAIDTLRMLRQNEGWSRFFRCFGSPSVTTNKPNGFYVIPLYTGEGVTMGHWMLIAINTNDHLINGWHIVSSGPGSASGNTFATIRKCFQSHLDDFVWNSTASTPQKEVECGPCTLLAMHKIAFKFTHTNL